MHITINNDRDEVYDKVNLVYEIDVKKGNYTLNEWILIARIKDNSKIMGEKTIKSIKSPFSTISIDISKFNLINNKFYQIEAELKCLKDDIKAIKTYTFKKINKIKWKVTFDEYGRMFINNELFFPFSIYVRYGNESELMAINRTHLNFITPWYESYKESLNDTLNMIDKTQNSRLKILIHLVDLFHIDMDTCETLNLEEDYKKFVKKINNFKDHPLIMGWYINDEIPECFNEHIRNRTLTIHELDPDHPTVSIENKRKHSNTFINTTDVYGMDCYPIGLYNKTEDINCYEGHNKVYNDLLKTKAMWPVPQIFDWTAVTSMGIKSRAPTLQEMKCMTWQALVAGARGLIFYSILEIFSMSNITPFESRWKDIIELTDQIWEYKDMILSIEKVHQIEYTENNNVAFRQWKYNGHYYIVIVNLGRKKEILEINLLKRYNVIKEFGLGTFKQYKNNITFYIEPIDALMVKYDLEYSPISNLVIIFVLIFVIILSTIIIYIIKRYFKKDDTNKFNDKRLEPIMDKIM